MSLNTARYGTWDSPISSNTVVQNSIRITSVFVDPITSSIYHLEARPSDGGRYVIVDTTKGKDLFGTGSSWDASTRVGEYGGGAATAYGGFVYFSNFGDFRVYKLDAANGGEPVAVTPENRDHRFADFAVLPTHPHLLVAILEDHTHPSPSEVQTSIVLINTSTKTVSPVISGADFYASPRFSPDGKHVLWKEWYHPDMPWEGTEIYVAQVTVSPDGEKVEFVEEKLAGGVRGRVCAAYPFWVSNETVISTNNISGYRNPWSYSTLTDKSVPILRTPVEMAFSLPAWFLGESYGAALDEKGEEVVYSVMQDGRAVLYRVNVSSGEMTKIESPYVEISSVHRIPRVGVIFIGGQSDNPPEIVTLSLGSLNTQCFKTIKSLSSPTASLFGSGIISVAKPIDISGPPNRGPVHVNFYPPTNPKYSGGGGGEKPPCVFNVHGGPTMASSRTLDWSIQYFTSRGWAWVDVNYGGSSGYGKAYIDRLKGQWGISVARDCDLAAQHLSTELNLIDPSRIFLRGRSAGGYSTMVAISNPPPGTPSGFKWIGATSIYGISDLVEWAQDMHKFQRGYVSWLVGGSYEEIPEVYKERSPITHADNINTPLLILHGLADAIVQPCQAERIFCLLKELGKKVDYIPFPGEGHGWRKAEHIKAGLEAELNWYEHLIEVSKTGTEL